MLCVACCRCMCLYRLRCCFAGNADFSTAHMFLVLNRFRTKVTLTPSIPRLYGWLNILVQLVACNLPSLVTFRYLVTADAVVCTSVKSPSGVSLVIQYMLYMYVKWERPSVDTVWVLLYIARLQSWTDCHYSAVLLVSFLGK